MTEEQYENLVLAITHDAAYLEGLKVGYQLGSEDEYEIFRNLVNKRSKELQKAREERREWVTKNE